MGKDNDNVCRISLRSLRRSINISHTNDPIKTTLPALRSIIFIVLFILLARISKHPGIVGDLIMLQTVETDAMVEREVGISANISSTGMYNLSVEN